VTIVRVFRARPKPGMAEALEQRVRAHSIPNVAAAPGLVGYHAGRPYGETGEFLMVTIWHDLAALRAFAGDDYEHPVLYADETELIEELWLHHYEGVA
jgi:quinol monooxygenase YgiN